MNILHAVAFTLLFYSVSGLDNGLARTPPMGWMSWERFRCNTDCKNDPLNCISERLFREMADELVLKGFKDAGYEYIIIDDCWLNHTRDASGKLQPDWDRFPSGIPALADYIHGLGLKFGIYEDYGNFTCGGYPGVLGHLKTDAQTFADWGVDYIKLDGCYSKLEDMTTGYPEFGRHLNETGREIVYSCSWPAYWGNKTPDYVAIQKACNLWRNYGDIQDTFADVLDIMDHYGANQDEFAQYAGPGSWNDPDMLIIGNFALSYDQARVQMAVWAVLAAPLIMSNDLRTIEPQFINILTNRNVIKINQDPIGHQGRRVRHSNNVDIFVKNIMPTYDEKFSHAVAIVYRGTAGTPAKVTFTPKSLGLDHEYGYFMAEVFEGQFRGIVKLGDKIVVRVNPSGVELLRFDVIPKSRAEAIHFYVEGNRIQDWKVHEDEVKEDEFTVEVLGLSGWREEL